MHAWLMAEACTHMTVVVQTSTMTSPRVLLSGSTDKTRLSLPVRYCCRSKTLRLHCKVIQLAACEHGQSGSSASQLSSSSALSCACINAAHA
jgi:hypothetical protein